MVATAASCDTVTNKSDDVIQFCGWYLQLRVSIRNVSRCLLRTLFGQFRDDILERQQPEIEVCLISGWLEETNEGRKTCD